MRSASNVPNPQAVLRAARQAGRAALDEPAGKALLAACGIRVPASRLVRGAHELQDLEPALRPPYALKVVSDAVIHKSDVGGVALGLRSAADAAHALEEMRVALGRRGIDAERWLIEEMAPPGLECVIGGVVDPEFGPMVMAGLGGVLVEVLGDVAFRICPIDRVEAREMFEELRGALLLRGVRGRGPVSIEALVDALLSIGGENGLLMCCAGELSELDINPLIVTADAAIAVDARFILKPI